LPRKSERGDVRISGQRHDATVEHLQNKREQSNEEAFWRARSLCSKTYGPNMNEPKPTSDALQPNQDTDAELCKTGPFCLVIDHPFVLGPACPSALRAFPMDGPSVIIIHHSSFIIIIIIINRVGA